MSDMDEIIKEFLVESSEGLDTLDRNLVALEQSPRDQALLASIFRCIHTIKGTSGFLGFGKLESVTHVGESLLSDLRDGKKVLTPEITTALLQLVDAVRRILSSVQANGTDGDDDFPALVALLDRLQKGEEAPPPAAAPIAMPVAPVVAAPVVATPTAAAPAEPASTEVKERRADAVVDSSIRVDVMHLDKLMNLVGELVLARNQILQYSATAEGAALQATSQRLNLITTELQEGVMKTRMQPIGTVWSKFPRVVRDLAAACSKQVRIEMEGKDTELDKTIIEAIKDPLTHIVRNSVDHGIESPARRVAAGKGAEGTLQLRAFHEGGQVNIEISDDGGGIDPERVRQKAVQRGLITPDQSARMTDREILNLIFLPGFSTAEQVTNVSGRGVGMDVVRTNIEKIGGTVDILSTVGAGTTLKIRIPLTLAIIPALVVSTAGDRYAIPQVNLLELVRLDGDEVAKGIETVHGAPVYRLRGNLLPLVRLATVLGLDAGPWVEAARREEAVNIVVVQADDRSFGLVVDRINDTEEIVVKPLGKLLKGLGAYAGATIMGDGKVALILDVPGLAQCAGLQAERGEQAGDTIVAAAQPVGERQTLLLFGLSGNRSMAIPLSMIARLEEFPIASVEQTGRHEVVQYRDQILPLIRLSELLEGRPAAAPDGESLHVVVYTDQGQPIGLVVDQILDIVEEDLSIHRHRDAGLISGSAVIQQKVTDLVDVDAVIAASGVVRFDTSRRALAAAGA
jgi:two-component system chemotaxis sensor kinase CheA